MDIDDVVWICLYHLVADDLHISRQHDKRHLFFCEQLHLSLFHLGLVGVVFLYRPHVEGDIKLFAHVSQILVIADDARYLDVKFSGVVSCQQVVEAVAHLADEDSHAWLHVVEVEAACHLVFLCIERVDIFLYLVSWNEEVVEFPFYAHEEHAVLMIYILVKINDVSLIVGDKPCYFRDYARLVGAMQEDNGSGFHFFFFCSVLYYSLVGFFSRCRRCRLRGG